MVLTRAGWLILLPLYWTALTPADFGIIGIAQLIQALLIPMLTFGLAESAQRFFFEWREHERSEALFTILLTVAISGGLVCAALDRLGEPLFRMLFQQVPFEPYLRVAIWTSFCGGLSLIPLAVLRVQERIVAFSAITVASFCIQAAVGIHLVLFRDAGPYGYLVGALSGAGAAAVLSLAFLAKTMRPGFVLGPLRACVAYGFPTAVVLLIDSAVGAVDRFFLDKHVSLAQIGLYNLASQFGSAFNVFNQALKTSWVPFLFRAAAERDDVPELLGRFAVLYLAILAIPALAIALLAQDFIEAFGGERYRGVYAYVPFFVLYYYLTSVIAAMGRGMDLAKRTGLWPLVPTAGLIVCIATLYWLVPAIGVWGAVTAILLGALTRAGVQIGLSIHYYPRRLYPLRLTGVVAIAAAGFLLGWGLAPAPVLSSVAFKSAVVLLCAPLLLWAGAGYPSWRSMRVQLARMGGN